MFLIILSLLEIFGFSCYVYPLGLIFSSCEQVKNQISLKISNKWAEVLFLVNKTNISWLKSPFRNWKYRPNFMILFVTFFFFVCKKIICSEIIDTLKKNVSFPRHENSRLGAQICVVKFPSWTIHKRRRQVFLIFWLSNNSLLEKPEGQKDRLYTNDSTNRKTILNWLVLWLVEIFE